MKSASGMALSSERVSIVSFLSPSGVTRGPILLGPKWDARVKPGHDNSLQDKNRPKVVHIGQGRPRDDQPAGGLEETIAIVVGQAGLGRDALGRGARNTVGT